MSKSSESGRGGMTGATGDLTPDDADRPFVPAELREISDPEHQAEVTTSQGRRSPWQQEVSPADPSYPMESRTHATEAEARLPEPGDSDAHADHEEHF